MAHNSITIITVGHISIAATVAKQHIIVQRAKTGPAYTAHTIYQPSHTHSVTAPIYNDVRDARADVYATMHTP